MWSIYTKISMSYEETVLHNISNWLWLIFTSIVAFTV